MKKSKKEVRLGIVGLGGMGSAHARNILEGKVKRCRLAAVCDVSEPALARFDASIRKFTDIRKMFSSGEIDAVLVATPHYDHVVSGMAALKAGLHALIEKPMAVQKSQCRKIIAAHRQGKQIFAMMFNQRTDPAYRTVREMMRAGQLGRLARVSWTITDWFRTNAYYRSGGWRATWAGEGGGVLVNQCPHQLDLLQWICGMPVKVRAFAGIGRRHKIEVEDEVTACLEYSNGATGVFVTSTGEAPGTNRLEIAGDMGKVVVEDRTIKIWKNEISSEKFLKTSKECWATPASKYREIKIEGAGGQHVAIVQNFTDAILDGAPLIAPAADGIRSVELANAMLYSALKDVTVELPMAGADFDGLLKNLVAKSRSGGKIT